MGSSKQRLLICSFFGLIGFASMASARDVALRERSSGSLEESKEQPPRTRAIAGSPIWGAGAAVGNSHGQFAGAFVQATSYSPGTNVANWTALTIADSGGSSPPGSAYWTRSLTGRSQGAYAGTLPAVSSPSQANGVAIFDSDFLDNGGIEGAFGMGTSPSPHRGELISPRIDLTGYTNTVLALNFYAFYREFTVNKLAIAVSTDDGATWSTEFDYRVHLGNLVQGFVTVNLPGVTTGVANLSQCRVKLIFDGDYYFAIVDDLSIDLAVAHDLALGVVDSQSSALVEKGDVVHLTENRHFPISQMSDRNFAFGAVIRNLGIANVTTAQSPSLQVTIERNISGTWTSVFTDAAAVTEAIPAGGYVAVSDEITNRSWVQPGDFRATYTASFNGSEDLTNNSLVHLFTITPDTYASKVDQDGSGNPLATAGTFPGGGPFDKLEFGSVFFFNAGTGAGLRPESISFKYRLPNGFNGASEQVVAAAIYTVDPKDGILNQSDLLTLIGICGMGLNGLGSVVAPGTYASASCAPDDVISGLPLGPLSSGHYFVSVTIEPATSFGVNDVPSFGTSNQKNYYLNTALSEDGVVISAGVLAVTPAGSSQQWYGTGFGSDIVPSIGIHLSRLSAIFGNGFEN